MKNKSQNADQVETLESEVKKFANELPYWKKYLAEKILSGSVKRYCYDFSKNYKPQFENQIIKYFCFFETSKDFFWSQNDNTIVDETINNIGLHFHLFVSSDKFFFCPHSYSFYLFEELNSQRNKLKSFSKYDYKRIEKLDEDFILYHTKQMMFRFSPELIMKNY